MAREYELIAMAYHEASHVICGLFNYMKVDNVYVISDKYENGNTDYEIADIKVIDLKPLARLLLLYEAQTLYAGLVGEKIYYKEICGTDKFPMILRIGSSNDIAMAAKIIETNRLCQRGKPRLAFKKMLQDEVHNILTSYWEDVRLIAHELYKHKHLSYEEVKYILVRRSPNKEFWKLRFKQLKVIYDDAIEVDQEYLKNIFKQERLIK